jgi:hypothetical protein
MSSHIVLATAAIKDIAQLPVKISQYPGTRITWVEVIVYVCRVRIEIDRQWIDGINTQELLSTGMDSQVLQDGSCLQRIEVADYNPIIFETSKSTGQQTEA